MSPSFIDINQYNEHQGRDYVLDFEACPKPIKYEETYTGKLYLPINTDLAYRTSIKCTLYRTVIMPPKLQTSLLAQAIYTIRTSNNLVLFNAINLCYVHVHFIRLTDLIIKTSSLSPSFSPRLIETDRSHPQNKSYIPNHFMKAGRGCQKYF